MTDRWRKTAQWAALGALSGTLATLAIFIPRWLGFYDALEANLGAGGFQISISPLSVGPGLVFGLVIGLALNGAGLAAGWRYPAWIAASAISYFVTVQISVNILINLLDNIVTVGIVAGAFGAVLLGALTAAMIPDFRQARPVALMILSGTVLGAALFFAISSEHFLDWLLLFAPWQAGYAAAMATALKNSRPVAGSS
jgi:hypothetical protein